MKSVSGKLELNKVDRNTYQQSKAGKTDGIKDGLVDDKGGHLIASIFKGPGEQINYAAMNGNLNKGAWKRMEINGRKHLVETHLKKLKLR
nr:DNA/RNA non-specific endonuclease [Vibrio vulnificus]